ncbi:adenine phosphoribosyltransferase 5-like isoform X1 [Mangifera indica]|uniref:adenine phosphoribosyltransferase 5-like isoform X1 n=1 Tax=Mangifera indica TaxID=29780 RepID=UPI001CFAAC07|nr:adenine phosphoribosyltransferase 5-like isoform X1 [Mangifera indica]
MFPLSFCLFLFPCQKKPSKRILVGRIGSSKTSESKEMFAGENGLQGDPRLKAIKESIRVVPHFPKPGIMFQDITTLLLDHKAFKHTVDIFVDRYRNMGIDVVAVFLNMEKETFAFLIYLHYLLWLLEKSNYIPGVEARGFVFGPPIALAIGAKFVPLRKPRKLPGEVISEAYTLEYGTDCLEIHVGAVQTGERVIVIDDVVATGGTLCAAIRLLERVGAEVVECACVIGLREIQGQNRLNGTPLYMLIEPRQ